MGLWKRLLGEACQKKSTKLTYITLVVNVRPISVKQNEKASGQGLKHYSHHREIWMPLDARLLDSQRWIPLEKLSDAQYKPMVRTRNE